GLAIGRRRATEADLADDGDEPARPHRAGAAVQLLHDRDRPRRQPREPAGREDCRRRREAAAGLSAQLPVAVGATVRSYTGGMAVEKLLLAAPRGYCPGVDRAVQTVERALELHGAPVYVRKEIVHNKHVVEKLRERGAVFVDELDDSLTAGAVTV